MTWIDKLEKRFGHYAIPHLTLYLLLLQATGVILLWSDYANAGQLGLYNVVESGEWFRLISFMMLPRTLSPLWILFSFLILYMMGSRLEAQWGAFRYNLFILLGYLLTVAVSFGVPKEFVTNSFFLGSIFFAFATLYPNIEFLIFFILPVKVKWLAWLTAGIYVFTLFTGPLGDRLSVLAAFATYLIFFGRGLWASVAAKKRREAYVTQQKEDAGWARHVCHECGISDQTHPTTDFRYCSVCKECFCEEHLTHHEHRD